MTIITDKMVFGGKCLGKFPENGGKNVFVPYAIPGETIEINITESKKDYDNGEIVNIVNPSEHRVTPPCKYYYKCGGCNMMHIDKVWQRELRKQMLIDIYAQNGIDISSKTEILFGPDENYRARFQLNDGGLSEKGSNNIIDIEKCLCAEAPVNHYLSSTKIEDRPRGRIHLFGSSFAQGELKFSENENSKKKLSEIKNKGKNGKKYKFKENHYFAGTVFSEENTITVQLNGKNLAFDVRGFFQSNLFVFEKVIKLIVEKLKGGKNILDMYSGCGSISAFLGAKYENVVLVEHNRDAIVYAEKNLAGTSHVSYGLSGANWVKNCSQFCGKFDACVIDPPRSGMEKEVRDYLCNSKIPQIISMSCDPATHGRDCAYLIKAGYELKEMYLLDFYPNTSHIESLAVFELKNL